MGVTSSASMHSNTSRALDFLAEVFGSPPDHQAGDEYGDDYVQEHAVQPRAHAAVDDLAQHDVEQWHQAAQRSEAVMHGIHRAVRGVGGCGRPERRFAHAEAHFLALHVAGARVDSGRGEQADCRTTRSCSRW